MEFLRERVYTALNADELKAGDKVIVADDIFSLRAWAESGSNAVTSYLLRVQDEEHPYRFQIEDGTVHLLAYLVERAEPKTEKEDNMNWNYVSEGKLPERQEMGVSDRVVVAIEGYNIVDIGYYDYDLEGWFVEGCRYPVRVYAWQAIKPPKVEE